MKESEKNLHAKIFDLAGGKECQAFEDSRVKFNASFHFKDKILTNINTSEGIFRVWKAPTEFFKDDGALLCFAYQSEDEEEWIRLIVIFRVMKSQTIQGAIAWVKPSGKWQDFEAEYFECKIKT